MDLMLMMLPFMLAIGGAFLGLFIWAVEARQYEDPEGEKHRIFFEDDPAPVRGGRDGARPAAQTPR
jgi:cbb3-type cytochrome oxidase maturation protein